MIQTSIQSLTLEIMRDMPIDQIVQLYRNGFVLEDAAYSNHKYIDLQTPPVETIGEKIAVVVYAFFVLYGVLSFANDMIKIIKKMIL